MAWGVGSAVKERMKKERGERWDASHSAFQARVAMNGARARSKGFQATILEIERWAWLARLEDGLGTRMKQPACCVRGFARHA